MAGEDELNRGDVYKRQLIFHASMPDVLTFPSYLWYHEKAANPTVFQIFLLQYHSILLYFSCKADTFLLHGLFKSINIISGGILLWLLMAL